MPEKHRHPVPLPPLRSTKLSQKRSPLPPPSKKSTVAKPTTTPKSKLDKKKKQISATTSKKSNNIHIPEKNCQAPLEPPTKSVFLEKHAPLSPPFKKTKEANPMITLKSKLDNKTKQNKQRKKKKKTFDGASTKSHAKPMFSVINPFNALGDETRVLRDEALFKKMARETVAIEMTNFASSAEGVCTSKLPQHHPELLDSSSRTSLERLLKHIQLFFILVTTITVAVVFMYNTNAIDSVNVKQLDNQRMEVPIHICICFGILLVTCFTAFNQQFHKTYKVMILVSLMYVMIIGLVSVWLSTAPCDMNGRNIVYLDLGANNTQEVIQASVNASTTCQEDKHNQEEATCIRKDVTGRSLSSSNFSVCNVIELPSFCKRGIFKHVDADFVYAKLRDGIEENEVQKMSSLVEQINVHHKNRRDPRGNHAFDERRNVPNSVEDAYNIGKSNRFCFSDEATWPQEALDIIDNIFFRSICESVIQFCTPDGVPKKTCSSTTCNQLKSFKTRVFAGCDKYEIDESNLGDNEDLEYLLRVFTGYFKGEVLLSLDEIFDVFLSNLRRPDDPGTVQCGSSSWYANEPNCISHGQEKKRKTTIITQNVTDVKTKQSCFMSNTYIYWSNSIRIFSMCAYTGIIILFLFCFVSVVANSARVKRLTPISSNHNSSILRERLVVTVVGMLSFGFAYVLFYARDQTLKYQNNAANNKIQLTQDEISRLEWTRFILMVTAIVIVWDSTVLSISAFIFRNHSNKEFIMAVKSKSLFVYNKKNTSIHGRHEERVVEFEQSCDQAEDLSACCCYDCLNTVLLLMLNVYEWFYAWFDYSRGYFYLHLVVVLESVESYNQVYQLFVFGPSRDYYWVVNVGSVLLVNALLIPLPIMQRVCFKISENTIKVSAAVIDLSLDSMFLLLTLSVIDTSVESFAGQNWIVAVISFALPALGALKTLHEVSATATHIASMQVKQRGMKNGTDDFDHLRFKPSPRCQKGANIFRIVLTTVTATCCIVFSIVFLVLSSKGWQMCNEVMGRILIRGSYPVVVMNVQYEPYCNVSQITKIEAPRDDSIIDGPTLSSFPSAVNMLKNVKEIDVTDHNISNVPLKMLDGCTLPEFSIFKLSGNPISKKLSLSGESDVNRRDNYQSSPILKSFDYMPSSVFHFFKDSLESLDVSGTSIKCIPNWIVDIPTLKYVNLSDTLITFVPPEMIIPEMRDEKYPNITFSLDGSSASKKLDWSYEFYSLSIENSGRFDEVFPYVFIERLLAGFGTLSSFESFNLAGNQLTNKTLPNFNSMVNLLSINVSNNLIEHAPWTRFDHLSDLLELDVSFNQIPALSFNLINTIKTQGNTNGVLTCNMIERFRTLNRFYVEGNKFFGIVYSHDKCSQWKDRFKQFPCDQGMEKVLQGIDELLRHLIPFLQYLTFDIYQCFDKFRTPKSVTLSELFTHGHPDKLVSLNSDYIKWGKQVDRSLLQRFQTLKEFRVRIDLDDSGSGNAKNNFEWLESILSLISLEYLAYRLIPDSPYKWTFPRVAELRSLDRLVLVGGGNISFSTAVLDEIAQLPKLKVLYFLNGQINGLNSQEMYNNSCTYFPTINQTELFAKFAKSNITELKISKPEGPQWCCNSRMFSDYTDSVWQKIKVNTPPKSHTWGRK